MTQFDYQLLSADDRLPAIGLIVLQTDETIEQEFRHLFPPTHCDFYVSRIPSGREVSADTLNAMAGDMTAAARLFPASIDFDVVAYGCTSGASFIGAERVAELIRAGCNVRHVTEPVTALRHACEKRAIRTLALVSPYVENVSARLRAVLSAHGIETPAFGSFNEASEAKVARISPDSIIDAAVKLARTTDSDGLFLSCTNLKTLSVLKEIEAIVGRPVLSSNSVLGEHVHDLADRIVASPGSTMRARH